MMSYEKLDNYVRNMSEKKKTVIMGIFLAIAFFSMLACATAIELYSNFSSAALWLIVALIAAIPLKFIDARYWNDEYFKMQNEEEDAYDSKKIIRYN